MICGFENVFYACFIKNQVIDTVKTWLEGVHDIPVRVIAAFIIFCLSFQWTHYLLHLRGVLRISWTYDIKQNTQLIAMNFICSKTNFRKFRIFKCNACKSQVFHVQVLRHKLRSNLRYATWLSKVIWLEYYPMAFNNIWCLETHEEFLITWNKKMNKYFMSWN